MVNSPVPVPSDVLEQLTGQAVEGYRAPTFSIARQTAWALEVLGDLGMVYDSSIYPVVHDRYGIRGAPREPFLADGGSRALLEFPLATLRFMGLMIPVGGGGYFRLLPLSLLERALRQMARDCLPPVAMLYFHPWEFDPLQARLPLGLIKRFRTYEPWEPPISEEELQRREQSDKWYTTEQVLAHLKSQP